MKTATHIFSLIIAIAIISTTDTVYAQGRGHKKAHENDLGKSRNKDQDHGDWRKQHSKDHHSNHHEWDYGNGKEQSREDHAFRNRHEHYRHHHPVAVHRYARPRYIYYRDYDVYFDFHRNVYITLSGRHWLASTRLPHVLNRVDIERAHRMEVNYDQDDFPRYLERQRPSYRRVYIGS